MARKITKAMEKRAARRYERAKLDAKIDFWAGKEIASQDPVKREEARMKKVQYQAQKQRLRIRKSNGRR